MIYPLALRRSPCMLWLLAVAVALSLGQLAGCGASNPYPVGTYERGQFFITEEMYPEAVSALDNFIRHNPTDSLAARAQFDKAKTYQEMEEYPLAAVEYQILRKDYPTSPLVEEAAFQQGVAYLRQVGRVERDITGAYEARLQFLSFSQEYPSSAFMPRVVQYMQEIADLMVSKRLEQVKVYNQLHRPLAAAKVLDDVLVEEGGSSLLPEVLWRRAAVAVKLEDPDTARRMLEQLIAEYPESEHVEDAGRELAELSQLTEQQEDPESQP